MNEKEFLKTYDANKYPKASITTDVLIFAMDKEELQVLLIRRGDHPFKGKLAMCGGFLNMDESIDECAYRELHEETNIDNVYLEQLMSVGNPTRDPRDYVLSVVYIALTQKKYIKAVAGDDAREVGWYNIKDIEHLDIAFDHKGIIEKAVERLQGKIGYTDVAFHLMPKEFTLSEAQIVFEAVLQEPLHKANFRRSFIKRVSETGKLDTNVNVGPKPKLYTKKQEE